MPFTNLILFLQPMISSTPKKVNLTFSLSSGFALKYINVFFHNFFPFRFSFFCLLLSFLGKTFKLRQKWIWWLELHFATLVRLAFRLGRDNNECFPKTFVQIVFPLLLFYFISILKVQNSQKVLMWSSYPQTDKPNH